MASPSPTSRPTAKRQRLREDGEVRARLDAFEGKHFITYDRSSVHRPPQAPTPSRPAGAVPRAIHAQPQPQPRAPSQRHVRRRTTTRDEYADLPPLRQVEEDDEDIEDERTLSKYQRESNSWLLFSGIFALITTLSITSFTVLPSQAHNRQTTEMVLSHLQQISQQMEARRAEGPDVLSNVLRDYNFTMHLPAPVVPTLAAEIRDEWVPALWYSSLLLTLMGTMVTLCIKHWLMSCTFYPSFYDPDPPEALKDAERLSQRRPSVARKAEMRKSRKETLTRTANTKWALPWLLYSAVGMFACGMLAMLASGMWLLYFPASYAAP